MSNINKLIPDVLRVHPEPFEYHNEASVHMRIVADPRGYVSFLAQRLTDISSGQCTIVLPPKALFTDASGEGDFRVMPCIIRYRNETLKVVKVVGTNLVGQMVPDQVTVGKVLCLNPKENFVSHIFEACLLSSARTGACAALAVARLGSEGQNIAIVGAGRVGYYTGLFLGAIGTVRRVVFADPIARRAEMVAAEITKAGLACTYGAASSDCVANADVVVVATTSTKHLFRPEDIAARLVVSVGADTEEQRELPPEWISAADLYVDTMDSFAVGDLRAWRDELHCDPPIVSNLIDLFTPNREVPGSGKRRVFISTGSGLMDALTVEYLLNASALGAPYGTRDL